MAQTDAELLALISEGDRDAQVAFATRHVVWARVYATRRGASEPLAKDVSQDVLLAMISRPPTDLEDTSARGYMRRIIRRLIAWADIKSLMAELTGLTNVADIRTTPQTAAERLEQLSAAWQAICELSTSKRAVFPLRYGQGLTFAEIAEITGRPEKTVWQSHHRALKKLRQKLSRFFV
jgi:RNA polymerase sigma factor (sigma-70 family)